VVTSFTYLGFKINIELGRSSIEFCWRTEISRSLFSQLEVPLWKTYVSLPIKIRVHQVLVRPVLSYEAETWVTCQTDLHCFDAFDIFIFYLNIFWDHTQDGPSNKVLSLCGMWCQRKILGIGWMDRVTNVAIRRRTCLQPVNVFAAWKHQRGRPCST